MADFSFTRFCGDDGDVGDNEEPEDNEWYKSSNRDGIVFLVDGSKAMFEPLLDGNQCHFQLAIRCIKATMQNKIIRSDKGGIGVVFYGTVFITDYTGTLAQSDGPNRHVNVYHDLGQPCASRILTMEDMEETGWKNFNTLYGQDAGYSLCDALWACADLFSKSGRKLTDKCVMLFTNNDQPHPDKSGYQVQARIKANDLHDDGIDLELIQLSFPGKIFDVGKFYKDLLFTADEEMTEAPDPADRLQELMMRVRMKEHRKRAVHRLPFSLTDGLSLAVNIYSLVRTSYKPSKVKLSKKDNSELKYHSKTYLQETGDVLMPYELQKSQSYGGKRMCFHDDEVAEMKHFGEAGLYLLGFKPRSSLKPYYHVKPAQFVYPDEKSVSGSTVLFTALLRKCLDRGVIAVCRLVANKSSPPRLVTLLPQEEEFDEQRMQTSPPGFQCIFLPFADDFRKVVNEGRPRASEDQIQAAKEVVKKLRFQFSSEAFENPFLQRHWRNIEALALDRDEPDEFIDYTMPVDDKITKKAGSAIRDFVDMVFPADYVPNQKRKAPGGTGETPTAKRLRAPSTPLDIDLESECKAMRLGRLTVAMLKEAARTANIPCMATRKADIIDAISAYYGME